MKCPELKHMPEEGLPVSISYLRIEECPLLTKRLQRKKGKEWRKIADIVVEGGQCSIALSLIILYHLYLGSKLEVEKYRTSYFYKQSKTGI
jgi:hypothetical protein